MLIPSAVLIHTRLVLAVNVVRHGVGVGTELNDAKRCTSPREGMSHAVGPDDWVDVLDIIGDRFFGGGGWFGAAEAHQAKNEKCKTMEFHGFVIRFCKSRN